MIRMRVMQGIGEVIVGLSFYASADEILYSYSFRILLKFREPLAHVCDELFTSR